MADQRRSFLTFIPAALFASGAGPAAQAAEVCVVCERPAATYRCAFAGDTKESADPRLSFVCLNEISKSGGHQLCTIARNSTAPCQGPLKTVAKPSDAPAYVEVPVKGRETLGTFNDKGEAEIAPDHFKAENQGAATPESVPDTAPEAARPGKPAAPSPPTAATDVKPEAPPKTVKEMVDKGTEKTSQSLQHAGETASQAAGDAAKTTGNALSKAGHAVTSAAKKTWTCLTSLFGDCKLSSD